MVRSLLILSFLFTFQARADFFGFGGGEDKFESKIPGLIGKVKSLKVTADPTFEDEFNKAIQNLENGVEEEKLFCSGEAVDSKGRTLPSNQKQLCMRELKKKYLQAVGSIFEIKKKYLIVIHTRQLERISDIQKQQEAEIDKNF
jgi:hypothetical protein